MILFLIRRKIFGYEFIQKVFKKSNPSSCVFVFNEQCNYCFRMSSQKLVLQRVSMNEPFNALSRA